MLAGTSETLRPGSASKNVSTIRTLLEGLIDYAGLFPPASLSMARSVENYAGYRESPWNWALGRYIVPASRLNEFEREVADLTSAGAADTWRLSSLGVPARYSLPCGVIDTIEFKAQTPLEIRKVASQVSGAVPYIEIPVAEDPAALIESIGQAGARVKIRTGGVTPDLFPSPAQVATFLYRCRAANVPFKATAGLHHPLRALQRLTYEPDSATGVMHGFINVFLAAALVFHDGSEQDALRTLEEMSPAAFEFGDNEVRWHGHRLTAAQLRQARNEFAISFGSCSFEEPIQDLKALGWL
jgi:hypothetical protein